MQPPKFRSLCLRGKGKEVGAAYWITNNTHRRAYDSSRDNESILFRSIMLPKISQYFPSMRQSCNHPSFDRCIFAAKERRLARHIGLQTTLIVEPMIHP